MAISIPWRRIAWITIISLPLAAVGAVVWGSTRDLSRYEARLAERIHKVTGRDIKIKAPLSIQIGREPALVAQGVTLSNAPWGSRPDLAQVRKITMYLDPFALFLGEVKVQRVVLEGADILVEHNEVADTNLEMLPPPDGSGPRPYDNRSLRIKSNPAFPWIGTIEVRDSVLSIVESPGRTPLVLNVKDATFKASASGQPLIMQAQIGMPRAVMFDVSGTIGTFDGWMRGLPGNIDVQGNFGDGRVAVKGTIGAQKGTNLEITAEGSDFSSLGPYLRLPLPSGGPYTLTAKTFRLRSGFKVEVPSLKVGNSELAGEAMFRVSRSGTPYATVDIDASKIDLAGLHAIPAASQTDEQTSQTRRFFPTNSFSARWLGRSQLTLNARAAEVTGLSSKVQNALVTLSAGEKRFTFRGAASIGDGSTGFDLVYDPAGRLGMTTLTGTASRVSFEDLSALLGLDLGLKGMVGDIDLRLRGTGRSAHDALNVANGTIDISAGKGTWPGDGLAGWPAETQRLLGGNNEGVPVNCLTGSFEVKSGIANLRRLVVDTPRAVMIGGGYVSFRNEGWEFILAPEARDAHNASLASPLRIKGGTAREATGALEPGLAKLLIGAGTVPSLTGTFAQLARQPNANACALLAQRVDGMRPGLRAQLPTPVVEQHDRANRKPRPNVHRRRSRP
ncbi:MAG: AsmA family protein [Proteobacteria bacterium]|nr:AsmA family protein [Pseudomonadota bacterium]